MKLNFDLCKNYCERKDPKIFENRGGNFVFVCNYCFCLFVLKKNEYYKPEKFKADDYIKIEDITEEEWNDINQMKIEKFCGSRMKDCPYLLEHMVEE